MADDSSHIDDSVEEEEEPLPPPGSASSARNGDHEEEEEPDTNVRIFLRVKPSKKPSGFFTWNEDTSLMEYQIPRDVASGLVNNSRTNYKFRFDAVVGMEARQDEVFDKVGRPCVDNALRGFNSTVFAYGQTGSGKTFTITGGAEKYEDRGLIPRALSLIFETVKKAPDRAILVHISYLEIYNNQGYDLLDPNHATTKSLEDLPRVSLLEDEDGNCHLRNLSMHLVHTEEDALNLLFLGDTNRAVSETAMNLTSSRSHCIFTVSLESRRAAGSEVVLRSKLHMVDLAGSERAHKTGAKGQVLREASYINASLHFLEMVIVALQEKSSGKGGRTHIPYRNSMLTSMLRDSLGGNCKTVMIATVSPEKDQTDESVSTCRFAQRVARVKNDARLNEEVDPHVIIRQLKAQVASLEEELAIARGDVQEGEELKDYELDKLRQRVQAYVEDAEPSPHLNMGEFTYTKMKSCFEILRGMAKGGGGGGEGGGGDSGGGGGREIRSGGGNREMEDRIQELEQLVQQRDNEIAIMVNMIRKQKAGGGSVDLTLVDAARDNQSDSGGGGGIGSRPKLGGSKKAAPPPDTSFLATFTVPPDVLDDPNRAFEAFKTHNPKSEAIRANKSLLKQKYDTAKALANDVNAARHAIKALTLQIDKLRKQQAIAEQGLLAEESGPGEAEARATREEDAEECTLKEQIEKHKAVYKTGFHELSELKKEIQHIQKLLEMSRIKLQKDFDLWYQRQGKGALLTESLLSAQPKSGGGGLESGAAKKSPERKATSSRSSNQEHTESGVTPPRRSVSPVRPEQHLSPQYPEKKAVETPHSSVATTISSSVSWSSSRPGSAKSVSTTKSSAVDEDVSGFYEALDILKRRSSRK